MTFSGVPITMHPVKPQGIAVGDRKFRVCKVLILPKSNQISPQFWQNLIDFFQPASSAPTALPQRHNQRNSRLLRALPLMLSAKHESCEFQIFKCFGLTRWENRIEVYRLCGRRSNQ